MGLPRNITASTGSTRYRPNTLPVAFWANRVTRSSPISLITELTAVIRQTTMGMMPVTQPMKVEPPASNRDMNPDAMFEMKSIV